MDFGLSRSAITWGNSLKELRVCMYGGVWESLRAHTSVLFGELQDTPPPLFRVAVLASSRAFSTSFFLGRLRLHKQNGHVEAPALVNQDHLLTLWGKSPLFSPTPLHWVLLTCAWHTQLHSQLLFPPRWMPRLGPQSFGFLFSPTPNRLLLVPITSFPLCFLSLGRWNCQQDETRRYLFLAAWDSGWCPDGWSLPSLLDLASMPALC